MNWLITILQKEARGRKFSPGDRVRFLTAPRKGKGKGIVLMPDFQRGEVVDYNSDQRKYKIRSDEGESEVHPRNIVPERFNAPMPVPEPAPIATVVSSPAPTGVV